MRYLLIPALLLVSATAFADPKAPPAPPAAPAASPPPPYAMQTFPDRDLEMCPMSSVVVERPASAPGAAWTLVDDGDPEWYVCDEAPKGAAAQGYAGAVRGSAVEGWRLQDAGVPVTVQMRGLVPFHQKELLAIGPKQKRRTTDMCAEGRPAHSVVCEGMADSPASDTLTRLLKIEAANRRATYFLDRGALDAASAELHAAPELAPDLAGMSATGRFKTADGFMTIAQMKAREKKAQEESIALLKRLIEAKQARKAAASDKS